MCPYSKTLYQCNHSVLGTSPLGACAAQRDFEAGRCREPCDDATTHARSTVRIPLPCARCAERKANLDSRLDIIKTRLAGLRRQLEGVCGGRLDRGPRGRRSGEEERVRVREDGEGKGSAAAPTEGAVDPVQEFLRRKRMEPDAHLMMFSDHLGRR
ncbi:hypothetical protein AAE478_001617 [Parahypoxylon ruwenzoriense]